MEKSFRLVTTSNSTPATLNTSAVQFCLPSSLCPRISRTVSFSRKPRILTVSAAKDEPKFDEWDQMELKFGRMIGEDPKLTLAKIMGRKSDPDTSYLEIEESFNKKKGVNIEEVPFDVSDKRSPKSSNGLNLVRPVPKKGVKFEVDNKPKEKDQNRLSKPEVRRAENNKAGVPNVILRKPMVYSEDDAGDDRFSRLRIQPNLTLNMARDLQKERFTDMALLKKPEPLSKPDHAEENIQVVDETSYNVKEVPVTNGGHTNLTLQEKPNSNEQEADTEDLTVNVSTDGTASGSTELLESTKSGGEQLLINSEGGMEEENDSVNGVQSSNMQYTEESFNSNISGKTIGFNPGNSVEAALLGKPKRLDQPVKATPNITREDKVLITPESNGNPVELVNFLATSPIKEHEDSDWSRAEALFKAGGREEVEVISSSTRGFVVSFGSLVGFLPYRNLAAKWKFLAFESWLRRKGLDPANYRQNLGVIGGFDSTSKIGSPESRPDEQIDLKAEKEISQDIKLEELLKIYDQEKLKFLSSFVGQKLKVSVIMADRKTRKLIFSMKPKEKEELVDKKRSLMAKLSVGDVVKCQIKKITYFGIFVEVEGVPALIHQTEVSWDYTLDPASYFKVGQIVEAKVHQLDFSLERIFLSLKQISPDPLMEALEAVVGDQGSLDGRLEAALPETEWTEVESLIQELQQFEGIQSVWKGRYFLSPGLAPTFQVYMAAMFEDQYKLLARSGNRVQEVMVQTSLGKEEIKSAILTCTNRVV